MYRTLKMANRTHKIREDQILAQAPNDATRWMRLQDHERMNFRVVPAQLATLNHTSVGYGQKFDDVLWPGKAGVNKTETIIEQADLTTTGADCVVEVQYKIAGQSDREAQTVERHVLTGTPGEFLDLSSCTGRVGFVRVLVRSLNAPVAVSAEIIHSPNMA